ncbi:AraC family transcriptional regulator [Candidatus Francisella endociliophora]|uniref:AraC family transcriptional regulator n=1 Tax=Candidatus Francisella endociliophora TaxID=653937 RepID=A0A097ENA3_9GAMM|nr:helix-turn-helix transcriptional regulator [Francisella sp. FSC1006]AIT09044.1 AraC family transcriptional regulator [Francisella sp. FSC1006]
MKIGQKFLDDDISNAGEWLEGPTIVAMKGGNSSSDENQINTRESDWHTHSRGKIFCVESGLIHVSTPNGSWVLPSNRAGWIPPDVPHKIRICGTVRGWVIFILPERCEHLSESSHVIPMSEVLRALALRATEWSKTDSLTVEQEHIANIICNEVRSAPEESLHLPMPKSQKLLKVANAIIDNPSIDKTLEEWSSFGAMSPRTLRRIFLAETGLSFSRWRQQAQLARGLDMLAQGISVTQVSDSLGYASPSNFIAMFRKAFGKTPKQYFLNTSDRDKTYKN